MLIGEFVYFCSEISRNNRAIYLLMMKKTAFICLLLGGFSLSALAQQDAKIHVIQDPMFWKLDLRLTKKQCAEIEDVNATFYSTLINAISEDDGGKAMKLSSLLHERSNSIWDILTPRQKTKWQKIEDARYTVKTSRRTKQKFF